jgi:hypothetical protein
VSVEGQDERAKDVFDRLCLEWKQEPEALKERAPVMSLALAALVESEARERELEAQRDEAIAIIQGIGRKVWDYHPPSSSRLGPGPAIDHLIESRAVLVEALRELVRLKDEKDEWRSEAELRAYRIAKEEAWAEARSLAGVVEAER